MLGVKPLVWDKNIIHTEVLCKYNSNNESQCQNLKGAGGDFVAFLGYYQTQNNVKAYIR